MNEELFHIWHQKPPSSQDQATINKSIVFLTDGAALLNVVNSKEEAAEVDAFTKYELDSYKTAISTLKLDPLKGGPIWCPDYGCVLLSDPVENGSFRQYRLIGLDEWTVVHYRRKASIDVAACSQNHFEVDLGMVSPENIPDFYELFGKAMQDAKLVTGKQRSAAKGEGHQKTPAFILHAAWATLKEMSGEGAAAEGSILGGTTDVGRHTGCELRATSWPLVRAACTSLLPAGKLFERILVQLKLSILEQQVLLMADKPSTMSVDGIDIIFSMLDDIALSILRLDLAPCPNTKFTTASHRVITARNTLDKVLDSAGKEERKAMRITSIPEFARAHCDPNLELLNAAGQQPRADMEDMDEILKRTRANLGLLPAVEDSSLPLVLTAMQSLVSETPSVAQTDVYLLRFALVKRLFLERVDGLGVHASPSLTETDMEVLQLLVTYYDKAVQVWINAGCGSQHQMFAMLRSDVLLATWIALCLVHKQVCMNIPIVKQYKMPLEWRQLSNCVLADRTAQEAAFQVAKYIRNHNAAAPRATVFDLNDPTGTFDFADEFVATSAAVRNQWHAEQADTEKRCLKYMQQVKGKQQQAKELRSVIRGLEQELEGVREGLRQAKYDFDRIYSYNTRNSAATRSARSARDSWEDSLSSTKRRLNAKNEELKAVLQPPKFLIAPLPQEEAPAKRILFFLMMPYSLQSLFKILFSSQETLVPQQPFLEADKIQAMLQTQTRHTWQDHYEQYSGRHFDDNDLVNYPLGLEVPNYFGPGSVDAISQGIQKMWFPEVSSNDIAHRTFYNPFKVQKGLVRSYFVEYKEDKFQWALEYPASASGSSGSARGNLVFAKQSDSPTDVFTKQGFLVFGSLRSFGCQQFRKLINAINERSLPLDAPYVRTVIRMAAFQLGDLVHIPGAGMRAKWQTDLIDFDGATVFQRELQSIANELRQTPRNHKAIIILGELAAFCSQFLESRSREISRDLTHTALQWADLIRAQMGDIPTERLLELRAKECLMIGYAVTSVGEIGEIQVEEAAELCRNVVRFHNGMVYSEESTFKDDLAEILVSVRAVMAHHLGTLITFVLEDGCLLTDALRMVITEAPSALSWTEVEIDEQEARSYCFETEEGEQADHYAINLLTGVLLVNGFPPGRLPQQILDNHLYRRSFGERNFEVVKSDTTFTTAMRNDLHFIYEFSILDDDVLIAETDTRTGWKFDLIDMSKEENWVQDLPVRLRQMHSHWICRSEKVLVMRPIVYNDRSTDFFCQLSAGQINCYQVPEADRQKPLDEMRQLDLSRFIVYDIESCKTLQILAKFEKVQYLHTLESSDCATIVHLPRYSLSFYTSGQSLLSVEHSGYRLAEYQQLDQILPSFSHYLVLEEVPSTQRLLKELEIKIIVPDGIVEVDQSNGPRINVSEAYHAQIPSLVYQLDTQQQLLRATSINSRLQLSAIFAGAGTMVPDTFLCMTGSEAAIDAIRQCWVNRPLSHDETRKLQNVADLSSREPALALLCEQLLYESNRLAFLYTTEDVLPPPVYYVSEEFAVSGSQHRRQLASQEPSNRVRRWLRPNEVRGPFLCQIQPWRPPQDVLIQIPQCPVEQEVVENFENELCFMVINVTSDKVNADFPLSVRPDPAKLERDLYLELEASWDSHQRSMQQNVDERWDIWDRIEGITMDVEGKYHTMNVYLNMVIATVPEDMRERHNLLKSVNRVPKLCFTDILRSTIEDQHIEALNPFLFVNARMNFQEAAQVFLSLSILRDRLRRIWACKNSQSDRLIQELTCVRKWKPSDHPRWLVFETEGRLQIRPEQAIFAQHLMEHPGAISQLNMGLGKMRVILPLLILHYANEGQPIPRVHVLSPLLRETIEYLHLHLSASVLGIAILEQPFHRQVNLTAAHVKLLMQSGRRVRRMCCQVVAPEQRLSLEMKLQELELNGVQDTPDALRLLFQQKFVNMFDESDALLSYRFQFIYAVGTPASLDELSTRSTICQALLRTLKEDPAVHQLLTIPNFADLVAPNSPCEFGLLRLTGMSSSDEKRIKLRQTVLHALMQSPPYELTRLRDWCNKSRNNLKQVAKFVIFDESKDKCKLKSRLIAIDSDLWGQVLALRGFLGFGIMEFCLEQRNQVDYGIDPRRLTKRMAVPFRAANVPSERSEFNHPDVSIMLTTLAYYYDGLSKENVRSALKSCLGMGLPAQQRYYTDWIQPIKADLTQNELEMIGDVGRIDLSNAVQFQLLYRKLHRSTELINFWLKVLVLRRDTAQFPQRIGATSWNIADGSHAIGFSGTNDNHRLLPLQVRQHEPAIDSIQGTNGRMVQLLIDHTLETCTLPTQHEPIIWKSLLIFALQGKYSALIDTGSLLAGASNEDAARFLISKTEDFDMKFKGVFYFDSNFAGGGNWMVLDRSTKQVMSRERSPIRDDAAFILFDDARTRGADMKMQYNAVALLTLGPKMTKDRLMQGAGRLRMLGRQQKLVVVATTDIAQNVCSITGASTMQIRDVLQWVMSTTELANKAGLYQWVQQGFTFCTNEGVPIDEDWSLETNYESPVQKISVAEHVANRVGMSADLMFVKVAARGVELGRDVLISSSAWDQMCERELQVERENEAEVAREVPCVKALPEKTWDYSAILQATSVQDLEPFVKFEHIAQSIKRMLVPADLAKVGWQRTNVFATLNFLTTVEIGVGFSANDFIRLIDMVLLIQNEEEQWDLLLLSDKEADAILEIFWGKTLPDNVALVNLTQLRIQMDSNDVDGSASDYMHIGEFQCPEADQGLAALQLFNGETTYSTPERKAALRSMIKAAPHGVASATLQELVSARGRMHDWFYSDLERIIYESLIEQVPIAVRS